MQHSNRRQRLGIGLAASALLVFSYALAAHADLPPDYGLTETAALAGLPTSQPSPATVTANIINIVLSVTGVAAVILVVYAGAMWMASAGNEEKIGKAKKLLAGAVIGLAIIFAAYAISYFIVSKLVGVTGASG
jgi:cytochrome bd-type quinol oxidase subunit 2